MIRSLLKIVKSALVDVGSEPVHIDNTVYIPPVPNPEPLSILDGDLSEEERVAREQEQKIAERIQSEVNAQVSSMRASIQLSKEEILTTAHNAKFEILAEASSQSDQILAKAKEQSEQLLEKAQAEAVELRHQAQQDGYSQGLAEGKAQAQEQSQQFLQAAARFLEGINTKKDAYFISVEEELRLTVLEITRQVLHAELKTSPDVIFSILKDAARAFKNCNSLKISLSSLDVTQEVTGDLEFMRSVVGNIPEIDVELLSTAPSGTVIVDNGSEIVDASVPTQLDLLKEILNNGRKS